MLILHISALEGLRAQLYGSCALVRLEDITY